MRAVLFPLQLVGALTIFALFLWTLALTCWLVAIYDLVRRGRDWWRCYFRGAC